VAALPNKRLKLTARVELWNESFFSAPQLKRDPLGGMISDHVVFSSSLIPSSGW